MILFVIAYLVCGVISVFVVKNVATRTLADLIADNPNDLSAEDHADSINYIEDRVLDKANAFGKREIVIASLIALLFWPVEMPRALHAYNTRARDIADWFDL